MLIIRICSFPNWSKAAKRCRVNRKLNPPVLDQLTKQCGAYAKSTSLEYPTDPFIFLWQIKFLCGLHVHAIWLSFLTSQFRILLFKFFCAKLKFYFLKPTDPKKKKTKWNRGIGFDLMTSLFVFLYLFNSDGGKEV